MGKTGEERFNKREMEGEGKVELIWEEPEEDLESLGVGGPESGKGGIQMSQEPERGHWQEKGVGGGGRKEVDEEKGSRKGKAGRKPRANGERRQLPIYQSIYHP